MSSDSSEKSLATRPATPATNLQFSRNFRPIDDDAAWKLADRIKNSQIIPKDFIGKPENIFIAICMGREVGLHPMQAVQSIMVVNGRPTMWGDALPALIYASGLVEKFEEEYDEKTRTAICTVRRKGESKDHVQKFSWSDAVTAGYDKKSGPWQTNPKRMTQMRARGFAARDKFADVLKGIMIREEVEDYEILDNPAKLATMPREVVNVTEKAEVMAAQSAVEKSQDAADHVQGGAASKPTEDSRIATAKEKFLAEYKVPGQAIDKYLEWEKITKPDEAYNKLVDLWKKIRAGDTTAETEFKRFMPADLFQ